MITIIVSTFSKFLDFVYNFNFMLPSLFLLWIRIHVMYKSAINMIILVDIDERSQLSNQ